MRKDARAAYASWNLHLRERRQIKLNELYSPTSCIKQIELQRKKRRQLRFEKKPSSSNGVDNRREPSTVINLSRVHLTDDELKVLCRGLSFCPIPRRANHEEILDDLEGYIRRLRLKEFFLDNDEPDNAEESSHFALRAHGCLPKVEMLPLRPTSGNSERTYNTN